MNHIQSLGRKDERENLDLAYRRLEEAKMRLGKFIQAREGGVSVNQEKDERKG